MKNKGRFSHLVVLSALAVMALAGCAEKGPILLNNIKYQPAEGRTATAKKAIVGVSLFKDSRGLSSSVLGTRTIPSGMQNDLVVQGTVADLVAAALKDALKAHGLEVKDAPVWDLTAEGMKAEGVDYLFGGEIKTLRLESTGTTLSTNLTALAQLRIVVGDPNEKKIIRTLDVNSKIEQQILYSNERLEEALSEALTTALDQIFQDEVLKSRLQLHEGTGPITSPTSTLGS